MEKRFVSMALLAATAAIASSTLHPSVWAAPMPTSFRQRPNVRRIHTSTSPEVKAWNAAIDAKRAAKKANRRGRK